MSELHTLGAASKDGVVNAENACGQQKRGYQAPQLKVYGSVNALTQAGSANGRETSGGPGGGNGGGNGNGNGNPGGNGNGRGGGAGSGSTRSAVQSDLRLKQNVQRIGQHPLGVGLYLFDYKSDYQAALGQGRQFGVLAQEVETVMPAAVSVAANGYKQVDYSMLGIKREG
jgi:hypothetical protein